MHSLAKIGSRPVAAVRFPASPWGVFVVPAARVGLTASPSGWLGFSPCGLGWLFAACSSPPDFARLATYFHLLAQMKVGKAKCLNAQL